MERVTRCWTRIVVCIVLVMGIGLMQPTAGNSARKQELRIAFDAGDTLGFDPHKQAPPDMDAFVNAILYRGLVRFKPGDIRLDRIEPDMAEAWEVSKDRLTWTFKIRKGIQWHKGFGEFTAQDAEWSLKRAMDPEKCFAARNYEAIKEVKALDPHTLQIVLKNPIPSLLSLLTNYHGGMMVCSRAIEKYGKDYPLNPIGTGPFIFDSYDPQQKTVFIGNPQFYRGKPILERVVVRYMTDLTTREFAIQKGEVDVTQGLREQQWVEKMKPFKDITVDVFGPGELVSIFLNQSKKPLDDVKVRRALLHAINKEELIKIIGKDVTAPLRSIVPADYLGGLEKGPEYKYAPDISRKLLAEAGYPKGVDLEMVNTEMMVYRRPMEVIQEQLRQAGINLKINPVVHSAFHSLIRKDVNPIVMYICARFPIADIYLTQFFHSKSTIGTPTAVTNFSHYAAIDGLLDSARVSSRPEEQKKMWQDAQKKILEDAAAYPLYISKFVYARKNYVDYGYKLDSTLIYAPELLENTRMLD